MPRPIYVPVSIVMALIVGLQQLKKDIKFLLVNKTNYIYLNLILLYDKYAEQKEFKMKVYTLIFRFVCLIIFFCNPNVCIHYFITTLTWRSYLRLMQQPLFFLRKSIAEG